MNRLKDLRASRKLTQQEIAVILGISREAYSKWENGVYDIDNKSLITLAEYYDTSTDYILGRDVFRTTEASEPEKLMREYARKKHGVKLADKDIKLIDNVIIYMSE